MKIIKVYILPFFITALLIIVVRTLIVDQYEVHTPYIDLCPGDRLLVAKSPLFTMKRGDLVIYQKKNQSHGISKLCALSGDLIDIDSTGNIFFNPFPGSQQSPIIIPGTREPVQTTPLTAPFYAHILTTFEQRPCTTDSTGCIIEAGRRKRRIHFKHDYYWIEGVGLLTTDQIKGKAFCISYSYYNRKMRWNRSFKRI